MNTADFATDPDCASLPPDFVQRLGPALAQARVLHLWCPERAPLQAAREAVLQALTAQGLRVHGLARGQWLPLLHTLNRWIDASLRGAALPEPPQAGAWCLEDAQTLSAEHLALIERVHLQFPELPLRLVLLSQSTQPPRSPAGAQVLALEWLTREPPAWAPEPDLPRPARPVWPWLLASATLLALAAGAAGWWLVGAGATRMAPPAAPVAEQAPVTSAPAPQVVAAEASAASAASKASAAEPASAPAAPVAASALRQWLLGLPEGSWVVLHGEFASAREAEAFKASDALLANARIVQAAWRPGQEARHGVLTGPFRSTDRAANYMQRLAWRAQARPLSREALLSP